MLLWLWLASPSLQMYLPMPETCSNSEFTLQSLSIFDVPDGMACILCLGHSVSFDFTISAKALTRHQASHVKRDLIMGLHINLGLSS